MVELHSLCIVIHHQQNSDTYVQFIWIINKWAFCVLKLADDRMALVSGISLDPEAAIGVTKKLPPKWIEGVDEVNKPNWSSPNRHSLWSPLIQNQSLGLVISAIFAFRSSMISHVFGRRWRNWPYFMTSIWIALHWMTAVRKSTQ